MYKNAFKIIVFLSTIICNAVIIFLTNKVYSKQSFITSLKFFHYRPTYIRIDNEKFTS